MMHNPVFESSMKRRMRSFRAPMLLTLYVLFLLLVSGGAILTLMRGEVSLGNLRAGLETYIYLSVMQFALIILVAPALTAGAISGERERQTLDLLLCTRVSSLKIVLGKLLSSLCFLALMIVSSLPMMALTLFYGGVGIWDMLLMQLFLLVTALACCSIGIFCSAVFKRTVTATVVAYLTIFALGVGTIIFPFVFQSKQLEAAMEIIYTQTASYGSATVVISSGTTVSQVLMKMPKLFFINPALGLMSMLVTQTGLLQNTFSNYMGYRGSELFRIIEVIGSIAGVNMVVMTVCSVVLMAVSTLLIKPGGRRMKRRK